MLLGLLCLLLTTWFIDCCNDTFSVLGYAEVSTFVHACEGDAVTKLTHEKIPYFNAPIYLQNKTQIGKVDEIFGPINESVSSLPGLYDANAL